MDCGWDLHRPGEENFHPDRSLLYGRLRSSPPPTRAWAWALARMIDTMVCSRVAPGQTVTPTADRETRHPDMLMQTPSLTALGDSHNRLCQKMLCGALCRHVYSWGAPLPAHAASSWPPDGPAHHSHRCCVLRGPFVSSDHSCVQHSAAAKDFRHYVRLSAEVHEVHVGPSWDRHYFTTRYAARQVGCTRQPMTLTTPVVRNSGRLLLGTADAADRHNAGLPWHGASLSLL